jgi:hypothetical protein
VTWLHGYVLATCQSIVCTYASGGRVGDYLSYYLLIQWFCQSKV